MVAAKSTLVTVVVPVLNDAGPLESTLTALGREAGLEVVVVDGSPIVDPRTEALRQRFAHVTWLRSAAGRGLQMNCGARAASGRWLVFLHADTRLEAGWLDVLRRFDDDLTIVGGSFRFALDSSARWARWIERGVRLRVRVFDLPYGDQALFARRRVFEELGGYAELPLMEDVDFIRRLRRRGRLAHADLAALTSARRWEQDGWIRRTVENVALTILFLAGRSPEALARRYHRRAAPQPRPSDAAAARVPR